MKALLYPEFIRDIDTTEVKLRRRHKTVVKMYRHGTTSSEDDSSDNSDDSSERFERQNAVDNFTTTSDDESKVYSGVKYKTGKHDSWDRTIYESFIDHGEDAGEIRYQQLHDSVSSFCFVTECDSPDQRESFMIGSKPIRYTPLNENNLMENETHLSTARMNLLSIKQRSEQSQNSSFDNEHKLSGENKWKNLAFENLLNIDESIKTRYSAKLKPIEERHHSMPNQFVGNRFNVSSLTEIFIPSCKNYSENDKVATPYNSFEEHDDKEEEQEEVVLHSSALQLLEKPTFGVSDEINAEILYNVRQFECDKAKKTLNEEDHDDSQLVPSQKDNDEAFPRCDSKFLPPATIYSSDSDSGMAGSYTLSPSEPPYAYHRSFMSHVSHPSNLVTSTRYFNHNTHSDPTAHCSAHKDFRTEKNFIHDDSTEGDNKTKLVINIGSGEPEQRNGFNNLYFSAMYIHWWRKENLPDEMIEALVTPSNDDTEKAKRGSDKGSGKIKTLKSS